MLTEKWLQTTYYHIVTRNAKRSEQPKPVRKISVVEAAKWQQDEETWQQKNKNNFSEPPKGKRYLD